jgi:hypothetical protein
MIDDRSTRQVQAVTVYAVHMLAPTASPKGPPARTSLK